MKLYDAVERREMERPAAASAAEDVDDEDDEVDDDDDDDDVTDEETAIAELDNESRDNLLAEAANWSPTPLFDTSMPTSMCCCCCCCGCVDDD